MGTENTSGVAIVGPGTPYVTPQLLLSAATGIAWGSVSGRNSTLAQQYAEQLNICVRATAMVDAYCNQPLRATVDTEEFTGPGDFRCQLQPTGVCRLICSRSPVLSVVSGQVSAAASFPRAWNSIPANQFEPERPILGMYGSTAPTAAGGGGQAILLAPSWVNWGYGRLSSRVQVTYINGWPHGSLTAASAAAATSLAVDDITGWNGAAGTVYDSGQQELFTVTAVTPNTVGAISGPGTLTVTPALTWPHADGTLVTTLPGDVIQSAILFSVAQALTRGSTATTVQSIHGGGSGGGKSPEEAASEAELLVHPYRRVI